MAQTYTISPRRDSLRINAYGQLDIPTTGTGKITDARVNYAINEAISEICDMYPAIEKVDTILVTRDTAFYVLNSDFIRVKGLFVIRKYGSTGSQYIWEPVECIKIDTLSDIFDTREENVDKPGTDTKLLKAFTYGRKMMFQPKNYAAVTSPDTFIVLYDARDTALTADASTTSIDPRYMDELAALIKSKILDIRVDRDGAMYYRQPTKPYTPREAELIK